MTRILFVSDVHLKPGSSHRPFLDFLEAHRSKSEALYLLGDIFDYWIGPRHLRGGDYRDVIAAFRDCASSGVRLYFVPGNRDYFVEEKFEAATGIEILGESAELELGGRNVLLAHGDFLYNRNPKHLAYRRLMRFPPLRTAYLSMPEPVSRGIVRGFRKVSKKTTPVVRWTREDLLADARDHFRRGIDVVVCGHIHAPQHVQADYRGSRRDVFILGDWEGGTQDYLEYDGEFRLRAWTGR